MCGLAVLAHVLAAQARRLDEVHLDRAELPLAAQHVLGHEVGLGAVEGGLALHRVVLHLVGVQRGLERVRRQRPFLVVGHVLALAAAQRELHPVVAQLVAVEHLADQLQRPAELFLDLVGPAEDVAVVLRQRPHARQAAQLARLLVAVERGELGEAQRQVAIGVHAHLVVQRHVAGAVHRLQPERDALIDHGREHHVGVVVEMAGAFEQVFLHQVARSRRADSHSASARRARSSPSGSAASRPWARTAAGPGPTSSEK